jgi:hypothetical protein
MLTSYVRIAAKTLALAVAREDVDARAVVYDFPSFYAAILRPSPLCVKNLELTVLLV